MEDHPLETRPRAPRFPGFDGLRALAALSVFAFHLMNRDRRPLIHHWGKYVYVLNVGVPLFFVLSGFLLYRPYVANRFAGLARPATREFYRRRILRIVPGFWASLTVLCFFFGVNRTDGRTWKWVIVNYGALQMYVHTYAKPGLELAWTIGVEMTFYAVLPLYAWALGRAGRAGRAGSDHAQIMRWELLGLAALVVMSIGWRWYLYERPHSIGFYAFQMPQWLPGMADYFAGGMLLAVLTVWYSHRGEPRWARSRFMPAVAWVVAWGAFATYVEVISLRTGRNGEGTFERLMHHQLFLVFAVALCVPAAFGEQGRGWIRRMLESRVLNRLALISFGVYLYHQAVIGWVYDVMGAERGMFTIEFPHGPDWPFWLMLTLSLAATCVMATGSYLFVEAPFLRRKHRPPKVPTAERSSAPVREA